MQRWRQRGTCWIVMERCHDRTETWGRGLVSRDLARSTDLAEVRPGSVRRDPGSHPVAPGMAAAKNGWMIVSRLSRFALFAALSLASCNEADGSHETHLRPAAVVPSATAPKVAEDVGPHPGDDRVNPEQLADERRKDTRKGDRQDSEWVPKEFTS